MSLLREKRSWDKGRGYMLNVNVKILFIVSFVVKMKRREVRHRKFVIFFVDSYSGSDF